MMQSAYTITKKYVFQVLLIWVYSALLLSEIKKQCWIYVKKKKKVNKKPKSVDQNSLSWNTELLKSYSGIHKRQFSFSRICTEQATHQHFARVLVFIRILKKEKKKLRIRLF